MEEAPFGLIELVLVFGSILALAGFETFRNRRELRRLRSEQDRSASGRAPD